MGDEWVRISQELIPFPIFGVAPIVYEEIDREAQVAGTYIYRLVELESDGDILYYGPYTLTVDGPGRTYADWAIQHFSTAELSRPDLAGQNADPDGDGLTNWQEFLARTDPRSANSVFEVSSTLRTTEGMRLHWNSVAGQRYKIAVSESMTGPFLPLENSILATDTSTDVVLPIDFSARQMYFLVIRVEEP